MIGTGTGHGSALQSNSNQASSSNSQIQTHQPATYLPSAFSCRTCCPAGPHDKGTAVSTAGQLGAQHSVSTPLTAQQAQQRLAQQQRIANGTQHLHVLHQYRQQHPQPTLQHAPMQQFEVESETPVHQRYLTVYNRKVRFSAPENPAHVSLAALSRYCLGFTQCVFVMFGHVGSLPSRLLQHHMLTPNPPTSRSVKPTHVMHRPLVTRVLHLLRHLMQAAATPVASGKCTADCIRCSYLSSHLPAHPLTAAPQPPTRPPNMQTHTLEFDVVGHPCANFSFSVTFPFHPYTDGRKGGEVCACWNAPAAVDSCRTITPCQPVTLSSHVNLPVELVECWT